MRIRFHSVEGPIGVRIASVQDVFSRKGEEYLVMSTGETVRLDRIVDVDESAPIRQHAAANERLLANE